MTLTILDRIAPPADERIHYGSEDQQFADFRRPERPGPHPCLIAIHGGFWRNTYGLDYLGHLCAAFTDRGFVTWNVEFRRVGDPGGGWPGTFRDVAMAVRHVIAQAAEFDIDPERVVVLGHSAGGHLASWLASLDRVPQESEIGEEPLPLRGAVTIAGLLDLHEASVLNLSKGAARELLGGSPEDVPDRYAAASPIALLPSTVSQLVVRGGQDSIVPESMATAYVERARMLGGDVTLLDFPVADHFDVVDPESAVWPVIADAVVALAESS